MLANCVSNFCNIINISLPCTLKSKFLFPVHHNASGAFSSSTASMHTKKLVFCFSILQCPQLFPVLDISYMLPYCTLLNNNLQEIILSSVILVIIKYQGTVML